MSVHRKLLALLGPRYRRDALFQFVLMVFAMFAEMLGVGLVVPALTVMIQAPGGASFGGRWMSVAFAPFGNVSRDQEILAIMAVLSAAAVLKMVYLAYVSWEQARFVSGLQADLSQRLFSTYLRQPYTFHLHRNSAELIRNAIGQVTDITVVVQQVLILVTELLVLAGIAVLLLVLEPVGTVVLIVTFGGAGWLFHAMTRQRLLTWGRARQYHEQLRIQHLQQGLGGVKEIRLLGREREFVAQYERHTAASAASGRRQTLLLALPRLWIELLATLALALLVFVLIEQGRPVDTLLPAIGLFAAAAFRFMPSANRVVSAMQNVRYSLPVIDTLYGELTALARADEDGEEHAPAFAGALALEQVTFRYPQSDVEAVRDISLTIAEGTIVGFVGGSGAGKSTLVDLVLGLLTPDAGRITVGGRDIRAGVRAWQRQIGYVPQSIFLVDDTLRRNIAFGLADPQIDDEQVWRAVRAAQLEDFVQQSPAGLDSVVGERGVRLSGGQRQRIAIARALYRDPSVLVLDEATSSLDGDTEGGVMDAVRGLRGHKTIIIVAHRLSTVEQCDRLFRIDDGRLVAEGDARSVLAGVASVAAS